MKTNSFIGRTGLWAVGLCLLGWAALAVSCTGMGREELTQGENASLTVTLSGQVPVSKAVGSPDDAEAVKEAENKLHNVTVFVFNSNGTLDKKHTFAPNQISETITGLVAGTKKVVVVANVPSAITFPDSINYGWFEDAGNVIDLDTQATTADGLFMSGEDTVVLSANTVSEATIPISRVVAKVKLGTLTIAPEAGHDAAKFALTKVMVMKARSSVKMGLPSVDYTPDAFYGGMQGDKSTVKTYLAETISTGDYANRYFYVLPSDNGDGNTTLITLAGTYDGQPVYFPFRINDTVGSDGATSDGTFIRRNSVYVECDTQAAGQRQRQSRSTGRPCFADRYRRTSGVGDGFDSECRMVAGRKSRTRNPAGTAEAAPAGGPAACFAEVSGREQVDTYHTVVVWRRCTAPPVDGVYP